MVNLGRKSDIGSSITKAKSLGLEAESWLAPNFVVAREATTAMVIVYQPT